MHERQRGNVILYDDLTAANAKALALEERVGSLEEIIVPLVGFAERVTRQSWPIAVTPDVKQDAIDAVKKFTALAAPTAQDAQSEGDKS